MLSARLGPSSKALTAAVHEAGVTLPLLQQSIILFQLALSGLVLGRKLDTSQVRRTPALPLALPSQPVP